MPPKEKRSNNGFMEFTLEWRRKYRISTLSEAIKQTGRIWTKMDAAARAPYIERAKGKKRSNNFNTDVRASVTGVHYNATEREKDELKEKERRMKSHIENTVSRSVKLDELEHYSYFFIMVNYFTKTLPDEVYIPAELAICEYSLKHGMMRMYQTHINPGISVKGYLYHGQCHASSTHNLPLPPNALGAKNLGLIYKDILNFISNENTHNYPPIYTNRDCMHIVESVLNYLKADVCEDTIDLNIYPIQYLLYIMKEATCELGELEKPKNYFITDAYFDRDFFEYEIGIACQYHEDIDRTKYCTQSYVTRWCYMFSDYMCRDIAIKLIPGRHCPFKKEEDLPKHNLPNDDSDDTEHLNPSTERSRFMPKPTHLSASYNQNDQDFNDFNSVAWSGHGCSHRSSDATTSRGRGRFLHP